MSTELATVGSATRASLWVAGRYYSVQSYELALTHNGIPELRAVLDVYHDPEVEWDGKAIDVDLPAFYYRYQMLGKLCQEYPRTPANFHAVISYSDHADKQELLLTGWLLAGVGLSGLAASGGDLGIRVRLRHPAAVLEDAPAALNVYPSMTDPTIASSTVVEAIYELAAAYRSSSESETDTEGVFGGGERARTRYKEVSERLRDLLVVEPDSRAALLPGSDMPEPFRAAMIPSIWHYFQPQTNQTFWDWLSHTLFSEYGISLLPTYWDTGLKLRAFDPWGPVEAVIRHAEVSELQQPSLSMSVVSGIDLVFELGSEPEITANGYSAGDKPPKTGHVFYVEDISGAIMTYGLPKWFQFATTDARRGGRPVGMEHTSIDAEPTSNSYAVEDGPEAAANSDTYVAAELMARQIFMEEFRRTDEIMLTLPLMLRTSGSEMDAVNGRGHLVPGVVAGLYALPDDVPSLPVNPAYEVNRFYVVSVTHSVDCKANLAYTMVKGAYVRSPEVVGQYATAASYMPAIKALNSSGTYDHILYRAAAAPAQGGSGDFEPTV